jgi:hypothetical protein
MIKILHIIDVLGILGIQRNLNILNILGSWTSSISLLGGSWPGQFNFDRRYERKQARVARMSCLFHPSRWQQKSLLRKSASKTFQAHANHLKAVLEGRELTLGSNGSSQVWKGGSKDEVVLPRKAPSIIMAAKVNVEKWCFEDF